jgi:hypothetical protein
VAEQSLDGGGCALADQSFGEGVRNPVCGLAYLLVGAGQADPAVDEVVQ